MNDQGIRHSIKTVKFRTDDAIIDRIKLRLLNPESSAALYVRLSHEIDDQITAGHLSPGETLPGERVLAERLALSRVTVRKAIDGLVETGRLIRRPGAGTEVAARVLKSLTRLTSFSEDITARGLVPGCIWLCRERARSTVEEARALEILSGAPVLRLHRIRTASGSPIAWERAAVPAWVIAEPDAIDQSLYVALEALGAAPVRAMQRLRAQAATEDDAAYLQCTPGAPLLVMERRCFDSEGRVVESTETRYRGDAYDFTTEIRR